MEQHHNTVCVDLHFKDRAAGVKNRLHQKTGRVEVANLKSDIFENCRDKGAETGIHLRPAEIAAVIVLTSIYPFDQTEYRHLHQLSI